MYVQYLEKTMSHEIIGSREEREERDEMKKRLSKPKIARV
jgi:hypothetical protein